jgi:1-acyl-sn-glycerol-3-phosphate acyltransferase
MLIKKGYDMDCVEVYWILWTIIFYILIKKCNKKTVVVILLFLIYQLSIPIIYANLTFLSLFAKKREWHLENTRFLYNNFLYPKIIGYELPKNPSIIIANYPTSYVEYLTNHLLPIKKICILLYKGAVVQSRIIEHFYSKDEIIFIGKNNEFSETQKKVKDRLEKGYSIIVYPEKKFFNRKTKYDITELRSGIFSIAQNIGCDITPIVFDHIDHTFGFISNSNFKIYIDKTRKVENLEKEISNVTKLFKKKLRFFSIK